VVLMACHFLPPSGGENWILPSRVRINLAVDSHGRMGDVLDQRKAELAQQHHGGTALEILLHVRFGRGAIGELDRLDAAPDARRRFDEQRIDAGLLQLVGEGQAAEASPDDHDGRIAPARRRRGVCGEIDLRTLALTPPRTSLDGERCRHQQDPGPFLHRHDLLPSVQWCQDIHHSDQSGAAILVRSEPRVTGTFWILLPGGARTSAARGLSADGCVSPFRTRFVSEADQ
jgi:hypothetical protein